MDCILKLAVNRKSVRRFDEKPLAIEDIIYALKAAIQAPSDANRQPWRYIIVDDKKTKEKIKKICEQGEKKLHSSPNIPKWFREWLKEKGIDWRKEFLAQAPILIAVLSDARQPYSKESIWISIGWLLLALEEKGLSSLTYTPSNPWEVRDALGAPKYYRLETIIPVGKEKGFKPKERRLGIQDTVYKNRFGSPLTI